MRGWSVVLDKIGFPFALLVVGLASVALHLPFLKVPMIADEGAYAYVAYFWAQGDRLYTDLLIFRPQAIVVIYRIIFATLGTDIEAIRLFVALYNSVTLLFVFLIARHFLPKGYSLLAALLFGLFSLSPNLEAFTGNAETFMNLPIAVSAFFILRAGSKGSPVADSFLAGILAGVATQIKPSGLAVFIFGCLYVLFMTLRKREAMPTSFLVKGLGGLTLGFALSLIPALTHGFMVGWDRFIYAAIGFSATRASPISHPMLFHVVRGPLSFADFLVDGAFLVVAVLARLALPRAQPSSAPQAFLWLWLFSAALGIAAGGSWWKHYYIQALPPLCILASLSLREFVAAKKFNGHNIVLGLSMAAALTYTLAVEVPLFFFSPVEISQRIWPQTVLPWAKEIGDYIAERTGPEERIFVAFADPEIYFLARRRAAYPLLFLAEAELSRFPAVSTELAEILEDPARRPAYVVMARKSPVSGFGISDFYQALGNGYTLEARFGPASVYGKVGH